MKIVLGILVVIFGVAMMVFAWMFFYKEETTLASLTNIYWASCMSMFVMVIGLYGIGSGWKEFKEKLK